MLHAACAASCMRGGQEAHDAGPYLDFEVSIVAPAEAPAVFDGPVRAPLQRVRAQARARSQAQT